MQGSLPPGITLVKADDFSSWLVDIQVVDPNPIYAGETYRLKFMFSQNYPIEVRSIILHHCYAAHIVQRLAPSYTQTS